MSMYLNLYALIEYFLMSVTSIVIKVLTTKLLKQGYRYHKLRKAFSNFTEDTMS